MLNKIILASKSEVRKKILEKNKIQCMVEYSNVDEDSIKTSLLKEKSTPTAVSNSLVEFKSNKVGLNLKSAKYSRQLMKSANLGNYHNKDSSIINKIITKNKK